MSHLLRRTKKSCLRLLRKMSTTKHLFAQKLEEEYMEEEEHGAEPEEQQADIDVDFDIGVAIDNADAEADAGMTDEDLDAEFGERTTLRNNKSQSRESLRLRHVDAVQKRNQNAEPAWRYDENQNACAIVQGLASKFFLGANGYEFQRLHQLRSDAASEVIEFDFESECLMADAVQFEKVRYKQDVRYLRHTPSGSSLETLAASQHMNTPAKAAAAAGDLQLNTLLLAPAEKVTAATESDMNGNSLLLLDDDCWADFDSKWQQLSLGGVGGGGGGSSRIAQLKLADSVKSSHESSSCTLETWIDDEQQQHAANAVNHHQWSSNNNRLKGF